MEKANNKPRDTFLAVDDGAGQSPLISSTTVLDEHCTATAAVATTTNKPGALGVHDVGGVESLLGQPVCVLEHDLKHWERQTHALVVLLVSQKLLTVDELRRGIEYLPVDTYCTWSYYEKWAASTATCLLERGVILPHEFDAALGGFNDDNDNHGVASLVPAFSVGQTVRVKTEKEASRWRKPHLRTPGYLFGARGVIQEYSGFFADAEFMAFRGRGRGGGNTNVDAQQQPQQQHPQHTYRVGFLQSDLWPETYNTAVVPVKCSGHQQHQQKGSAAAHDHQRNTHSDTSRSGDMVYVEIFESWLDDDDSNSEEKDEKDKEIPPTLYSLSRESFQAGESSPYDEHGSREQHHHDGHESRHHDDSHHHLPRDQLERLAIEKEGPETPGQRVAEALLQLLDSKQLLTLDMVRQGVEKIDSLGSHAEGPRLVARAWTDPAFKNLLLSNAEAAVQQLLGISSSNTTAPTILTVVESTPLCHNLVVCTLCSCYPLSILGLSPSWYKSRVFRARAVREPRAMLADSFGLELPAQVAIHVHDSTADRRYMVLPLRPTGTEDWTEEELCSIVTRDCMIGVAVPKADR